MDAFPDMLRQELAGMPRIVYEFDAPDTRTGYLYPAMARTFRTVGAQFVAMFAYDMLATASRNLGWQTHYLNLVYTPRKAMSAIIAAEAMRRLPRMRSYGPYPENTRFGDFHVSYATNLGGGGGDHADLHPATCGNHQAVPGYCSAMIPRLSRCGVHLAVVLACSAGARPLLAQTVRGDILDVRTGRPVPGVAVVLLDRDNRVVLRAQTDADGRYVVQAPEAGSYRLRFEMPGYRMTITELWSLKRDEARDYPVRLAPASAIALDTVVVAGEAVPRHLLDFYVRKSRGQGSFLTPADLERLHPVEPTDVVRRLEGFDVGYDQLEPSRKLITNKRSGGRGRACVPVIFVDGVYVGTADTYDVNAVLWVDKLDAVESYPSAARIPIEYNTTGTQCGVIAFWTKR